MVRLQLFLASCLLAFASPSAFAQQAPNAGAPGAFPPYAHMWGGGGWGWHPGMMFAPFVMLFALIGVVVLIVWIVRWATFGAHHRHGVFHGGGGRCPYCGYGQGRGALDILEERFARGEIDKAEFDDKRKLLGR